MLLEMLLKWRWDCRSRCLPLSPGSTDVEVILLWSSRIWLFQNTLKLLLRAGHWGGVSCERRVFKHRFEPRAQQMNNVL